MVSEYGANAGVSGSLSVSGSVTFKGESDVNVDSNTLFVDASTNRVGVGSSSPISALDVAGKIAITSEASTPSQPSDGQGYLYAKSDGKIYWRSYDVSETDLTAGGGGSGISHDGSTADGVLTYKDSDEATVESNLTFDGSTLTVAGDIGVDHYIRHNGDTNTHINFTDDKIVLKAGNKAMVTMEEKGTAPHEITLNDGANNIDFVVKGNGSNEGNPLLMCDASNNRVGINGVGSPDCELHVDGNVKVVGEDPRIKIDGDTDSHPGLEFYENGTRKWIVYNDYTNDNLTFKTDSTTRMSIQQAGNVGIGTSSPDTTAHIMASDASATSNAVSVLTLEKNDHVGLQFLSPNNKATYIMCGDPQSDFAGGIRYDHSDNSLAFKTNGNYYFQITSAGKAQFLGSVELGDSVDDDVFINGTLTGSNGIKLAGIPTGSLAGSASFLGVDATNKVIQVAASDYVTAGSANEYYHLTLSGRVKNTNGNLFGHAAYPYNAGDADWMTSLSSYVSNWTSGGTTFDATYLSGMLYFTIGVAPAAMSLSSARIAYYMANDNMTDDYIWEVWKATPTSGTGYSTSLTWTRVGYVDRGGDPASETFYAATGSIPGSNSLAAGDLIGLTVHNPGDTYTNKSHGYHLVLRFTYS